VSDLAWPTVVVTALMLFPKQIADKIRGLTALETGVIKARFESDLGRAEALTFTAQSEVGSTSPKEMSVSSQAAAVGPGKDEVTELPKFGRIGRIRLRLGGDFRGPSVERINAQFLIHSAGLELDDSIARVAKRYPEPTSTLLAVDRLAEDGVIARSVADSAMQLLKVRNGVAYSPSSVVDWSDAERYSRLVEFVTAQLDAIPDPDSPGVT
jgi:hypothetical protein